MVTSSSRLVLVGVDGSAGSKRAIRYGVQEARRAGRAVCLVHVVPDYVPMTPMMPLTPGDLRQTGEQILREAEAEAARVDPDVVVTTELRSGPRVAGLVGAADEAALIVVGHEHRPLIDRILTGATTVGVTTRASCPVVSVPDTWEPDVDHGVVVTGLKSPAHSAELLAEAFAAASSRGARLVVLHAWKLPSAYDDLVESQVAVDEWVAHATSVFEPLLTDWKATYPDVEVELRVRHDQPAHALVSAAAEADLLVLVRRARGIPAFVHLGSTGRAVLRVAACPVEVVPPEDVTAEVPNLVLERAGDVQK